MTEEYSRVACCSEGPRAASSKRRNTPSCKHVVHTLRRASIDVEGLRRRAKRRAETQRAQSVEDRKKIFSPHRAWIHATG